MIESKQLIVDENVEKLYGHDLCMINSFLSMTSSFIRAKHEIMGVVKESELYEILGMPYNDRNDKAIVSDVNIDRCVVDKNYPKIRFVLKYDVEED